MNELAQAGAHGGLSKMANHRAERFGGDYRALPARVGMANAAFWCWLINRKPISARWAVLTIRERMRCGMRPVGKLTRRGLGAFAQNAQG
jgi:hypothetical protein